MKAISLLPDREVTGLDGRKNGVVLRMRSIDNMFAAMEWSRKYHASGSSTKGSKSFTQTESIDEYIAMLRDGYEAGVEGMQELGGLTSDAADKQIFVARPGGAFANVPAYLSGHPAAMLDRVVETDDSARGVTLVIDSCFSASVHSEEVIAYCQEVMRLVAWLQAERIDTSVYSVIPIRLDGGRYLYCTPIREAGMVLQPERIAAVLHPSWLRRAWFALLEYEYYGTGKPGHKTETGTKYPEAKACRWGYGSVSHANADEMRAALPEAQSVILLPKIGDTNPKRAVEQALNVKINYGG